PRDSSLDVCSSDCRVAALLQRAGVAGPFILYDPLAAGVQQLRHERVKRPAAARAVAVHDDELRGAARPRAAHRPVGLLRVELAPLLVHRVAARDLLPLDDARDAFHVADDVYAHSGPFVCSDVGPATIPAGASTVNPSFESLRLCGFAALR